MPLQDSWQVYEQHAMGHDELAPLTLKGQTTLGGLGAMVVDSLTTLWMLDLQDEFWRSASEALNEKGVREKSRQGVRFRWWVAGAGNHMCCKVRHNLGSCRRLRLGLSLLQTCRMGQLREELIVDERTSALPFLREW